ncbi:MAG: hypothetical protein IRD7MM_04255 [Candidatus Midichloria mitochondrii]
MVPNSVQHILSSILIGLLAALTFSRIIAPETEVVLTEGDYMFLKKTNNALDIVFNGIMDGAKVMVTIIAMFIGFISLINIFNKILANIVINDVQLSIQYLLGIVSAPIARLMGIPWEEANITGRGYWVQS